jgi:nucleoside-diphosphate-sugar epimerase
VERAVLAGRLPATVLRLPAVYGPGDPYRRLRPYIKRMDDRRPAILLETAHAGWRWTYGYVEDVAHAIALAVTNEQAVGKIYNIGETVVPTMAERVRRIAAIMGWSGGIVPLARDRIPPHLRAPYEPHQDLVFDTRKIRQELGFAETLSTDDGLRRTVEWERANPPLSGDPDPAEYAAEDAAGGAFPDSTGRDIRLEKARP